MGYTLGQVRGYLKAIALREQQAIVGGAIAARAGQLEDQPFAKWAGRMGQVKA